MKRKTDMYKFIKYTDVHLVSIIFVLLSLKFFKKYIFTKT
jgi:hypothetical protein